MPSNGNDKDTARPRFHMDSIQNVGKSRDEGRPIFDDKEMVEIRIPGDKLLTWVGEVDDKHRARWPEQYAAFKRGEERAASGTPLEQWPNPAMTKGRVSELKAQNILSVEELSSIPDATLPKLGMGARELREQAREWIAKAKDGARDAKLAAENAELKSRLERLEQMINGQLPTAAPEKKIEDCSDEELKSFIERETGEKPRTNASRDKLLARVTELANAKAEAA